ncbi:hypothetical protein DFQ28_007716 [Apophysomyces sp. BC1034]|nr:hypothetical protein DFQ30_007358 [Apophysomyces sp. BC1015]KAG0175990.1 hypothetical protein DFQ29_006713 [Apophysomyces sp. BC1021]KAG0186486.1 hypothetical protein DFQ28_007716 [Apophysomyces sp. BC1034]
MPARNALIRVSSISQAKLIFDKILTLLERISEEAFWENLLGPRLSSLCKKYFGNDVVLLSVVFYAAPILRTNWERLVEILLERVWSSNSISVEIKQIDGVYDAVNEFVRKNVTGVPDFKEAFVSYAPTIKEDDDEFVMEKVLPKVGFYPVVNTTNEIEYKGHTLYVTRRQEDGDKPSDTAIALRTEYLEISMKTKSMDLLKQFIQEWCDIYNQSDDDNIDIYKYTALRWSWIRSIEPRSFGTVNLKEGVKEKILQDMETFCKRKKWYKSRGIPYRRGYLLHGPPGTGKTSLIQALASKMRMNVAIVSLLEVKSDSDFSDMLSDVPSKSILVIEDIDHYMSSVSGKQTSRVTMSGMLNALDGIQGQEGSMVFMTGNQIDKLNPALLRPGRMDVKVLLTYADRGQTEDMFWRFFGHDYDTMEPVSTEKKAKLQKYCNRFLENIPEDHVTTAEIQNYFITILMESGLCDPTDEIFAKLIEGVPDFLSKVKIDRDQAEEHRRREIKKKLKKAAKESDASDASDTESSSSEDSEDEVVEDTDGTSAGEAKE